MGSRCQGRGRRVWRCHAASRVRSLTYIAPVGVGSCNVPPLECLPPEETVQSREPVRTIGYVPSRSRFRAVGRGDAHASDKSVKTHP